MKYLLVRPSFKSDKKFEISEDQFYELKRARTILSKALAIEEIYEIVISNYLEFEQEVLKLTLNNMVYSKLDYHSSFDTRSTLNKRIINVLTTVRQYLDTISHNVKDCFSNGSEVKTRIDKIKSEEYDGNRDYQFMEAFRNHVQHRGLAIHLTRHNSRWTATDGTGQLEYSLSVFANLAYLKEDKKFKKSILNKMDEKIDLKIAIRHYIEGISNIHDEIRKLITNSVKTSRDKIDEIHASFNDLNTKGRCDSLRAVMKEDNKQIESIPLLLEWDDVRKSLREKNERLINLSKRYVTGNTSTK